MGCFISLSAFPCGTFSVAQIVSFSVARTKVEKWFVDLVLSFIGVSTVLHRGWGGCGGEGGDNILKLLKI